MNRTYLINCIESLRCIGMVGGSPKFPVIDFCTWGYLSYAQKT